MKQYKTEGIVIKRKNYGEADRLITLFTKRHGKLQIKATGVRKITSRRSPHIELLNHTAVTLYKGKTYPVLVEAQSIDNFSGIKEDLPKVGLAYHICELIDCLCPEAEEHENVFDLFRNTLQQISQEENTSAIIHNFEVQLLIMLGYWHGHQELSDKLDTNSFIESIIERRLKSKRIFSKLE